MSKGWDNNTLKKLKTLVSKGLSASEIGKRLDVSKNAVIGKLNRLGWNAKATETTKNKAAQKNKKDNSATIKSTAKKSVKNSAKKVATKSAPTKMAVKKSANKIIAKKQSAEQSAKTKKSADIRLKPTKPVIKTASKKTKKDLALHELLIQHALQLANLKPNQCRWPIGDPDSENFHFCGEPVFAGKPYCYEHCRQAYQFTPPKKK